jgi:hypothetical protein
LLRAEAALSKKRELRLDLLFSDAIGRRLLVEIKRRPIQDKDVGQLLRYAGVLLSKNESDVPLRKMLIGTFITPSLRRGLEHSGIECKELDLRSLEPFLTDKCESVLAQAIAVSSFPASEQEVATMPHPEGASVLINGERIGPSTYPILMRQVYRTLLTRLNINPEELTACSNANTKQRVHFISERIETREAFARIAPEGLCHKEEFEIFPIAAGTCGLTTRWAKGAAERVIGKMNQKLPGVKIILEPGA